MIVRPLIQGPLTLFFSFKTFVTPPLLFALSDAGLVYIDPTTGQLVNTTPWTGDGDETIFLNVFFFCAYYVVNSSKRVRLVNKVHLSVFGGTNSLSHY
jgi:hypothetical protein